MSPVQDFAAPTVREALLRLAYRWAYRVARAWWFVRRPRTAGALVALWAGPRLLLIRTSYRPHGTLPGGFLEPGESPRDAAVRELREEVGVDVAPDVLREVWRDTIVFESRDDTVNIFEVRLDECPDLRVDRAEVVWAAWVAPGEALRQPLLPHVHRYLRERRGA